MMVNGHGPYYAEVRSVRYGPGNKVRQEYIRYIGKTKPKSVAPAKSGRLAFEPGTVKERKVPKTWSRLRYERAASISRTTGAPYFQADALANISRRMGLDPEKVNWDELQGKDLSYDDRIAKLEESTGFSTKSEKDYELEYELWIAESSEREAFRAKGEVIKNE